MIDIGACLDEGAERLKAAGIVNARHEARLLLAHATGLSQATIIGYPEKPIDGYEVYRRLVERRAGREPISHLIGRREFWSLEFEVTPDTLDPRPDSEAVVEAALAYSPNPDARIRLLDLGTGTGCLLAALLSMLPAAHGIGVERNPATAAVTHRNLSGLRLSGRSSVVVGDWASALSGSFDLIVSNPPYIPSADIETLQPEVALFEPIMALDGGADGLDALRSVVSALPSLLADDGIAVLEFGDGQSEAVTQIVVGQGLLVHEVRNDLSGTARCLVCGLTKL
jgi:release factor glutamine methyltransferase